ncbi:MAG: T9SS type A sorting domain-containing protein [Bacteroidales bacterium]|nr:T9SS type A sorting domain-containing protein [Bacteroidales bacterium]
MKKVFTSLTLFGLALGTAFAQNITLEFTGATNGGVYVRMDSVRVQNVSRSWSETVFYPDTVLTFQQTGIAEVQGTMANITAYPNPANGTTNAAVTMPQSGDATLQVFNLAGQMVAERTMSLPEGKNLFEVRLQTAQVYLLAVTTAQGRSTVKLLNRGFASECDILFRGNSAAEKRLSTHIFQSGDVLKIIGYATHNGSVVSSREVLQLQTASENFTLFFTPPNPFSVSANTQVYFSPSNLQWSATNGGSTATTHTVAGGGTAAGTWRFAPNQWDTIGAANSNISSSYSSWIDLFGWGTSGYNSKYPYTSIMDVSDYVNTDANISGTNYDWGVYNAIYNPKTSTTDAPGTWRTLTNAEWDYLINTRSTTSGIRYAKATVNGVCGLILVPDNWLASTYALDSTNTSYAAYTSNVISEAQWTTLENAGCAFLPAAGHRHGTSVYGVGSIGGYWSATYSTRTLACGPCFDSGYLGPMDSGFRYYGLSVRLVRAAQ